MATRDCPRCRSRYEVGHLVGIESFPCRVCGTTVHIAGGPVAAPPQPAGPGIAGGIQGGGGAPAGAPAAGAGQAAAEAGEKEGSPQKKGRLSCWLCYGEHNINQCPKAKGGGPRGSGERDGCYNCGSKGHRLRDCPKPRPMAEEQQQQTTEEQRSSMADLLIKAAMLMKAQEDKKR